MAGATVTVTAAFAALSQLLFGWEVSCLLRQHIPSADWLVCLPFLSGDRASLIVGAVMDKPPVTGLVDGIWLVLDFLFVCLLFFQL